MKILICPTCKRERVYRDEVEQAKDDKLQIFYVRTQLMCPKCKYDTRKDREEDFETMVQETMTGVQVLILMNCGYY